MKRLALYTFWEKDGIVRDYVTYYLNALKNVADDILVIANGGMQAKYREQLQGMGIDVLERENLGLDFGAWKKGLEYKGWDYVYQYDELILCNCSCYGPVYPFSEMFENMDKRVCDFWGITRHPEAAGHFLISKDSNTEIKAHLQSYFLVFRKKVLFSKVFRVWWDNLVLAKTFAEEVGYHETKFTLYLEEAGFHSDSYTKTEKYFNFLKIYNPLIFSPINLLAEDKNPLVKRKLFYDNLLRSFQDTILKNPREVFDFVKNKTNYPVENIWNDLLATQKMSLIKNALHINYVLSSESNKLQDTSILSNQRIALICLVHNELSSEEVVKYIAFMPKNSDIYIISSKQHILDVYRKNINSEQFNSVEYRLNQNCGKSFINFLIANKNIAENHDYVCFAHDNTLIENYSNIVNKDFMYHGLQCSLFNETYVNNILELFLSNKQLGMLVPPTVEFGPLQMIGKEIYKDLNGLEKVYRLFNVKVPIDNVPIAPLGLMFWIRGKTLFNFLNSSLEILNSYKEDVEVVDNFSKNLEMILPIIVQDNGYYTGWVSSELYSSLYMNNLAFSIYVSRTNKEKLFFKLFKYKLLSKITFGKTKQKYIDKYTNLL